MGAPAGSQYGNAGEWSGIITVGEELDRTEHVKYAPRYRVLDKKWHTLFVILTTGAVLMVINQLFLLQPITRVFLIENSYLYALLAIFLSLSFILFPASKKAPRDRVPWYDVALFLANMGVCSFFAWHGKRILLSAYEFFAPTEFTIMAGFLWLLALEASRRTSGKALFYIILIFSGYPLLARYLPGFMGGFSLSVSETARYFAMSVEGIVGMPMRVVGGLLIGFIIMGMVLAITGGGPFFLNLASAAMGRYRGGPAKISVVASALFGTMSGSVVGNVLTTGTLTIPAMKRIGYPATYAGGIETCASTGGVLMPPVMGTTAFLMASLLGIPYLHVVIAATIPSILYYFGLILQIDAYAARVGMKGLAREEIPPLGQTLRKGWYYIITGIVLVYLLLYLKHEAVAPFYATALLLVLTSLRKETRLGFTGLVEMMALIGRTLTELIGVLAGVGVVIGSLVVTGMAPTLAGDLVQLAGGNVSLMLIMGAAASFVLGIGMTNVACYAILAITLAPAVVSLGLNLLAVHLFIMYWGMISFITPPVAIGAYAAASIAEASPMRTGLEAMRLGAVIYFLPFFFVLNPMLTLQNVTAVGLATALATAGGGIFLISCGLQGYIIGIGSMGDSPLNWAPRVLLVASGVFIGWPGNLTTVIGLIVAVPLLLGYLALNRRGRESAQQGSGLAQK